MKARCTSCNTAKEVTQKKGKKLSDTPCPCGGEYRLMRGRTVDGEAPLPGFTHTLFGKVYHVVYVGAGGEWLYDRAGGKFVNISDLGLRNADLIQDASTTLSMTKTI